MAAGRVVVCVEGRCVFSARRRAERLFRGMRLGDGDVLVYAAETSGKIAVVGGPGAAGREESFAAIAADAAQYFSCGLPEDGLRRAVAALGGSAA